jgi:SagB-type dehydrogenase family enzyme
MAGLNQILEYHERTKHHFGALARGPGFLDWSSQPDPFRRYAGACLIGLERVPPQDGPGLYPALGGIVEPQPVNRASVSRLLYDSLALSAWKRVGASTWALRVNPSSGNLHPTEAYLLSGPVSGLLERPSVCHYAPREHALELRTTLSPTAWHRLAGDLPLEALLIGLASIHWREAWKYGERAYRYSQLDVGHAVATVAISAAGLGWRVRLLDEVSADELGDLLGLRAQTGPEAEEPDCVMAVIPSGEPKGSLTLDESLRRELRELDWKGRPNRLSTGHLAWEVIDRVAQAARKPRTQTGERPQADEGQPHPDAGSPGLRPVIHGRRSAVAMDGRTWLEAGDFFRMLHRLVSGQLRWPGGALPWEAQVHLALFVHRVHGIAPGLYVLVRNPAHQDRLRGEMDGSFRWEQPAGCPQALPLFQLQSGDFREVSRHLSCHQDIASDGCFSLGMLARFEPALERYGPWFYPRLFWECGLVGQLLYLEAVASGIAATGIGCFFDDPVHRLLGLRGREFQSLYHFTVGGALEDSRLVTLPPYPGPQDP